MLQLSMALALITSLSSPGIRGAGQETACPEQTQSSDSENWDWLKDPDKFMTYSAYCQREAILAARRDQEPSYLAKLASLNKAEIASFVAKQEANLEGAPRSEWIKHAYSVLLTMRAFTNTAWRATADAAWDAALEASWEAARGISLDSARSLMRPPREDSREDPPGRATAEAARVAALDAAGTATIEAIWDIFADVNWDDPQDNLWDTAADATWEKARKASLEATWDAAWVGIRAAAWDAEWSAALLAARDAADEATRADSFATVRNAAKGAAKDAAKEVAKAVVAKRAYPAQIGQVAYRVAEEVVLLHYEKYALSLDKDEQGIMGRAYVAAFAKMTSHPRGNIFASHAHWKRYCRRYFGRVLQDESRRRFIEPWLAELERIASLIETRPED